MDKRIDNIVENSETIDKATGLYVFSWIRESSAREYFSKYSSNSKRSPETGLYIWPYEPSEPSKQALDLKTKSSDTSSILRMKNMSDAFEGSLLAELGNSGHVFLSL